MGVGSWETGTALVPSPISHLAWPAVCPSPGSGGDDMSYRRMLVLALLASVPTVASAQFTTFIPPQNKVADSVKAAVVAEQKAQSDSLSRTQLTNMRTWVDS